MCIGVFYFTLGNIPPEFRSKIRQIQLAAIVKCDHIKKYGVNAVLKPILDDVKQLVSSLD